MMHNPSLSVLVAAVGLSTLAPMTASAQRQVLDRAVFVVTRGSQPIGREEVTVYQGRTSGPGFSITATAHYPSGSPTPSFRFLLELGPDSLPLSARIDITAGDGLSAFVVLSPRRITVRTVTPTGESARQAQGASRALVLDGVLTAPFAILPGRQEGDLTLLEPRLDRRSTLPLVDGGQVQTRVGASDLQAQLFTIGAGDATRRLWYDMRGRLVKLEVPAEQLVAVRGPGS